MSSENAVPRRTRPTNANKHPGEIVLQAKNRRRTAKEMTAAKDAKAAKSAANQAGIERLAGIELEMEKKQVDILTRKAQPVRPPPKGKSKGSSKVISEKDQSLSVVADDEAQGGLTEDAGLENREGLDDDGPGKKKKKKKGIKESISEARISMRPSSHHDGGDNGPICADQDSENALV